MKRNILIIIILFCSILSLNAQEFKATYLYDANGNRESASVIYLSLKSAKIDSTELDTTEHDLVELELEQETDDYSVRIYPNPTQSDLLVEINGTSLKEFAKKGNFIKIVNLSGKLMINVSPVALYNTVDLTPLVTGPYILLLYINGKAKTYKIIKK